MKKYLIFGIAFLWLGCSAEGEDGEYLPSSVKRHQVGTYTIDVFQPDISTSDEKLPVIYINDGQWLLGSKGSGQNIFELVSSLISSKKINPVIVVGIHSKADRSSMFIPYDDEWVKENWGNYTPNADGYTNDIIKTIIPFVEKNYHAKSDRQSRAIFGFSLGGLHALWTILNYSSEFGMAAGSSPSLWVGNDALMYAPNTITNPTKIWFDMGTAEWNWYTPFQVNLLNSGLTNGTDLFYYEVFGGTHTTGSWMNKIVNPIMIFAGSPNLTNRKWIFYLEVIPSQTRPGVYFQRINTVSETVSGVKFSLGAAAQYSVTNNAGSVGNDGRFEFTGTNDLKIRIQYPGLDTVYTVSYSTVQSFK